MNSAHSQGCRASSDAQSSDSFWIGIAPITRRNREQFRVAVDLEKQIMRCWLLVLPLLLAGCAANAPPTAMEQQTLLPPECLLEGFEAPDDLVVYAAGGYEGRRTGYQIDESGNEAKLFDVVVNETERPVALLLGSYEPEIWNIKWTPETVIAAVYASGYHTQRLAGLPPDVPQMTIAGRGPDLSCVSFYDFERREVLDVSLALFGRAPERIFEPGAIPSKIFVGEPPDESVVLQSSPLRTPHDFYDLDALPAGMRGIDQLLVEGKLRKATMEDVLLWFTARENGMQKPGDPPLTDEQRQRMRGTAPRTYRSYVVLEPFVFPASISGTFYIQRYGPRPSGRKGHAIVRDMNDFGCLAAPCIP